MAIFSADQDVCCRLLCFHAAGTLFTLVLFLYDKVDVRGSHVHDLFACPQSKESRNVRRERVVHSRPVDLLKLVAKQDRVLVKEVLGNRPMRSVMNEWTSQRSS